MTQTHYLSLSVTRMRVEAGKGRREAVTFATEKVKNDLELLWDKKKKS